MSSHLGTVTSDERRISFPATNNFLQNGIAVSEINWNLKPLPFLCRHFICTPTPHQP